MSKIARMTGQEMAVLGDLVIDASTVGRFDWLGNLSTKSVAEGRAAVRWTADGLECEKFWKGWLPTYRWTIENGDVKQFSRQNVAELLAVLPNAPDPIGEFSFCFGPAVDGDTSDLGDKRRYVSRLYAVYQAADGDYYLARGNTTFDGWERYERLVFVPSGAYHPSIAFDAEGHFTVAAEFQPASGEIELWIYQYPYSGDAIRVVVRGIYCRTPVLLLDHDRDLLYFYGNSVNLRFRAKSENYSIEHTLPIATNKHVNIVSIKLFSQAGNFDHVIIAYIMEDEKQIRYIHSIGYRNDAFYDSLEAEAGCHEITWELVGFNPIIDRAFAEIIECASTVESIVWEISTIVAQALEESIQCSTSVQSLAWMQITIVEKAASESISGQTAVQSILWVRP